MSGLDLSCQGVCIGKTGEDELLSRISGPLSFLILSILTHSNNLNRLLDLVLFSWIGGFILFWDCWWGGLVISSNRWRVWNMCLKGVAQLSPVADGISWCFCCGNVVFAYLWTLDATLTPTLQQSFKGGGSKWQNYSNKKHSKRNSPCPQRIMANQ